jgi:hypothetical protein
MGHTKKIFKKKKKKKKMFMFQLNVDSLLDQELPFTKKTKRLLKIGGG